MAPQLCYLFIAVKHKEFEVYAISAMDDQLSIHVGRTIGGIGVLWRQYISHACTICDLQDDNVSWIRH